VEREGEDVKADIGFGVANPDPCMGKPIERVAVVVVAELECVVFTTGNDSDAGRFGVEESIPSILESDIDRLMSDGNSRAESGPV